MNINILGISELKWTEMGEFNSDDHYVYYSISSAIPSKDSKEYPLLILRDSRRNGVALIVNKSLKCSE